MAGVWTGGKVKVYSLVGEDEGGKRSNVERSASLIESHQGTSLSISQSPK